MIPLTSSLSSESEALNEIDLLATLRHPNIIRYITSYRHGECLVIVTVGVSTPPQTPTNSPTCGMPLTTWTL
jgi:serine/threonine protein kinase